MPTVNRRDVLLTGLGLAGTGLLAGCSSGGSPQRTAATPSLVEPNGPQVAAADAARTRTGRTRSVSLTATPGTLDLGGPKVRTWTYGERLPGREIRITAGDTLVARFANHLPQQSTVHWHGVPLRNDMDGVPYVTQRAVPAGGSFTYRFTTDAPGTYWFHPHVGLQRDRGLYGPLIVEDPHEPLAYDDEWVVVLDDWLDGVGGATPDQVYAALRRGMAGMGSAGASASSSGMPDRSGTGGSAGTGGMPGMGGASPAATASGMSSGKPSSGMSSGMSAMPGGSSGMSAAAGGAGSPGSALLLSGAGSPLLGGDAGDVKYPYYLVNGRVAAAPDVYTGKPGRRLRIRIINAGGDTAFRVALGGHRLTVTHTDGYPVRHETADALLIAPGERYDVLVRLGDGVFPLTASAEGKGALARALVRTGSGTAPAPGFRPAELDGQLVEVARLEAAEQVRLAARTPDVTHRVELTGSMGSYAWSLNGERFELSDATAHPLLAARGQRVRVEYVNRTTMWHPMHLHGHTYQQGGAGTGPRKDTSVVLPGRTVVCDFDADNPGRWLVHCHNVYHAEAGMMGLLAYSA